MATTEHRASRSHAHRTATTRATPGEPVGDDYREVESLFAQLADAGTENERQRYRREIIRSCLPLADHIAYRFVGRGEPVDDLIQVARLSLVKAVDGYRCGAGYFLAFAVPTIVGGVRRHFRDNTWAIHVPRSLKETHQRARATVDPLSQRLGRAPTASELADELGVNLHHLAESIDAGSAYRAASLDAAPPGNQSSEAPAWTQQGSEDPRYRRVEDALTVAEMVSDLSERERLILAMRFDNCMTQSQIGERLNISQVQVSRLLSCILEHLRSRVRDESTPAGPAVQVEQGK